MTLTLEGSLSCSLRGKHVLAWTPYLRVLGGGEKYLIDICRAVIALGASVTLASPLLPDRTDVSDRFPPGLPFECEFTQLSVGGFRKSSQGYDVVFQTTNREVVSTSAGLNLCYVQYPGCRDAAGARAMDRLIVTSQFVADAVARTWHLTASVLHPIVGSLGKGSLPDSERSGILSVGRYVEMKRHDVLLDAYSLLCGAVSSDILPSFHLLGGLNVDRADAVALFESLVLRGVGMPKPVAICANVPTEEMRRHLERASLLWHAAGYGVSEPAGQEHFGIAIGEAMFAGVVPVVFRGGGVQEVVGEAGYSWTSVPELVEITARLLGYEEILRERRAECRARARRWSEERFVGAIAEWFPVV